MFLRNSRISSVMLPMPMAVKKLMEKRVLRGLSLGKRPSRLDWRASSRMRSVSFFMLRACARSSKRILMKMRELEVVSSSLRWMTERTCQPIASEARRWPKNWAMILSLLVSYLWIVS